MSNVQLAVAKRDGRQGGVRSGKAKPQAGNLRDWTIKSLPPETVEVSRDAARKSGMKINAWVGKALQNAADGTSASNASATATGEIVNLEHSILREIAELKEQNLNLTETVNSISAMLLKMYTR
jgi:hypothetical protein